MTPKIEITFKGRKWIIIGRDSFLELFYVQEVGRNFKTTINFDEVK